MRVSVSAEEAFREFPRLLEQVIQGAGEVTILQDGRPVAWLLPVAAGPYRVPGTAAGTVRLADDFDDPLPDEVQDTWEQ